MKEDEARLAESATDIADWLGRCEVRPGQETDNREGAKEALVLALKPRFDRQVSKPPPRWRSRLGTAHALGRLAES